MRRTKIHLTAYLEALFSGKEYTIAELAALAGISETSARRITAMFVRADILTVRKEAKYLRGERVRYYALKFHTPPRIDFLLKGKNDD